MIFLKNVIHRGEGWNVLVLCGKVLVAGGVTGVAPVRSCWKLPLCSREPIPAGSKTDPPLAKAEPISDSGNASVITLLRRKKVGTGGNSHWREE